MYSDIMAHFNILELTMDDFMEILIVTTPTKDRWEFCYENWMIVRETGETYPDHTRSVQGHKRVDLGWFKS